MSGFEARWLNLREPVDHAARDTDLRRMAIEHLVGKGEGVKVVDLGCGTGSTFRALLPESLRWHWLLLDNDPLLLAEARSRHGDAPVLETAETDLAALSPDLFAGADLVTASALFDLVSAGFVQRLAEQIQRYGAGLYAALNYDGTCQWGNRHPADADVVAAFNEDQRRDKGFGPALGPESGPFLKTALEAAGFRVSIKPSPWVFTPEHAELHRQFIEGMASAVAAMRSLDPLLLEDWRRHRLARAEHSSCTVGHWDVLALP